jgi:hypothetical protein
VTQTQRKVNNNAFACDVTLVNRKVDLSGGGRRLPIDQNLGQMPQFVRRAWWHFPTLKCNAH